MSYASPADVQFTRKYLGRLTSGPIGRLKLRSAYKKLVAGLPPPKSVRILRVAADALPDNEAIKIDLAKGLLEIGQFGESGSILRELSGKYPQKKSVSTALAKLAEQSDDWALAKERWTDICSRDPGNNNFLRRLAHCHRQMGDLSQAEALYDSIVRSGGSEPTDHYRLETLRAWRQGSFLTVQRSLELASSCPQNSDVAALHAENSLAWATCFWQSNTQWGVLGRTIGEQRSLRYQLARAHEYIGDFRGADRPLHPTSDCSAEGFVSSRQPCSLLCQVWQERSCNGCSPGDGRDRK